MLIDLHKHLTWSSEDGYFKYKDVWAGTMEKMMKEVSDFWGSSWFEGKTDAENKEWEETIATGRLAEKGQFLNIKPDLEDGTLADARSIADARSLIETRIRWRVIMDDLWAVDAEKDNLGGIDERARRSRIARKIMRQEIGGMVFHWEWEDWYLRALPRIAEALGYEVEGIIERFDEAFERYCARPNGPGLRLDGLADTCYPSPTRVTEEDMSYSDATYAITTERKASALSDSTSSSQDVTPSYSPLSLEATAASSTTDLTSLSDSEIDLGEQAEGKPKEAPRIFIPKHKPLPPIDVESYELGWM